MVSSRICAGLIGSVSALAFMISPAALAVPQDAGQVNNVGNCFLLPPYGGRNTIIMPGSTSLIPVVQVLGARLAQMSNPYLLVYFPMPSCDAMGRVNNASVMSGTAQFYTAPDPNDPTKITTQSCSIDGTVPIDLAVGDTFFETCDSSGATKREPSLGDFQGPEQAFVFIAPRAFQYTTYITDNEARCVFGCGAKGQVAPYFDDSFIYSYSNAVGLQFGAQLIIGKAIGLISFFDNGSSGNHGSHADQDEANGVASSTSPDRTIGFISAEVYDQMRDQLKSLAFRGAGQTMAYYPDSNSNTRDKRNVRDGHYMAQAPMHMWAALNPDGSIKRPLARKLIDWMQGNPVAAEDQLPFDINDVYAQSGVIPKCAMTVSRSLDGGPFSPYVPEQLPCGCSFESKATGSAVPAGCVQCLDNTGCKQNQICSYGFCEQAW
jgi:hypothetical protein